MDQVPAQNSLITEFDVDLEDSSSYSIYNTWILLGYIHRIENRVEIKPGTIREMDLTFIHTDTADYLGATSSCNYFGGEFSHHPPDSLQIGGLYTTLVLCHNDEEVWECWYYDALPMINNYKLRGNSLTLLSPEYELVYRIKD